MAHAPPHLFPGAARSADRGEPIAFPPALQGELCNSGGARILVLSIDPMTRRVCARSLHDTPAAALRTPRVRRRRIRPGTRSRGGISPERGGARALSRRTHYA